MIWRGSGLRLIQPRQTGAEEDVRVRSFGRGLPACGRSWQSSSDSREFGPCCYCSAEHQRVWPGLQTSPITDPMALQLIVMDRLELFEGEETRHLDRSLILWRLAYHLEVLGVADRL